MQAMNLTLKKYGKYKQALGEKFGQIDKTEMSDEFKEMEAEMESKLRGTETVLVAANKFAKQFKGKKEALPLEVLGESFVSHAECFTENSPYSEGLNKLGTTSQKIADLQTTFAHKMNQTILTSYEKQVSQLNEYKSIRKKLESRRITLDAANHKFQRSKRDDSKSEEEVRSAEFRYEQVAADLKRRIVEINESDNEYLYDLTDYLDALLSHYQKSAELLLELRSDWPIESHSSFSTHGSLKNPQSRRETIGSTGSGNMNNRSLPRAIPSQSPSHPFRSASERSTPPSHGKSPGIRMNSVQRSLPGMTKEPSSQSLSAMSSIKLKLCKANLSFDGDGDTELSFATGDVIRVIEESDSKWWLGELQGRQGLFPVRYCSLVTSSSYWPENSTESLDSPFEGESVTSETSSLGMRRNVIDSQTPQKLQQHSNSNSASNASLASIKKAPPPPPASRINKPQTIRSFSEMHTSNKFTSSDEFENSGSEQQASLRRSTISNPKMSATVSDDTLVETICRECGCDTFEANAFRKSQCRHCFHSH